MLSVAASFCDYLPHGTEVFDDDALDAAAVVARDAWIEALGFTPAERVELVRQEEARAAARYVARQAMTDEEHEAAAIKTAKDVRQRWAAFLGNGTRSALRT